MNKKEARLRRAKKNRAKIAKQQNIRLSVHRSNNHIYAQLIAADGTKVLTQSSSLNVDLKEDKSAKVNNIQIAAKVGHDIAEKAKKVGIKNVAFDRSGYKYHGRVKALADAAKSNGLIF